MKPAKKIVALLLCLVPAALGAKQPNIIFILADDLGIGGLHCFGNKFLETPNIDQLCSEGMKFTKGLAAYPTCRPSRAAIITGQYGPRTGVYRVRDSYGQEDKARWTIPENHQLDPGKPTFAKAFKNAGYATAMFGKWHVSNEKQLPPTQYGFDVAYVSHGAHYNAKSIPPVDLPDGTMIEEVYTNMARDFIRKSVKDGKPFLLYMPYFLVHAPFEARKDYIDHFKEKLKGFEPVGKHPENLPVVMAMTKMLDDFVGRLLATLPELGIENDTIVVFTSDNGSYDRNLVGIYRGQKGDTYDGGMRVPYIFKWKGKIKPGSVSDMPIIGVDLYPTFLALAGIPKPKSDPLDGIDISPVLLGKAKHLPDRPIYCCYPKYARYNERKKRWAMSWRNVIYDGPIKLIEYPEYDEYELFNIADDPQESKDLSRTNPEIKNRETQKLHKWLEDLGAPKLIPNPEYSGPR